MSDPNGSSAGSTYSYPQYQTPQQQVSSQQPQTQSSTSTTQTPTNPSQQLSTSTSQPQQNLLVNRSYPYNMNYEYDPSQLQPNQIYNQYASHQQYNSQLYHPQPPQQQQPAAYQYSQPQGQSQQSQQGQNQAPTDYYHASRSYQMYNPYVYQPSNYIPQNPTDPNYRQLPNNPSYAIPPASGSNINLPNTRAPLQAASQAPLIDPNQLPQRPKLTTTFWEDEGTVCYQVESRGLSVSRREDTNFINGTKLLNVAGMTRGRRDGILKSEKVRYVVKIGAMNLKGVWIPFERALELARNEGIVDLLYPLFVKDIKELYQGPQYSGGLTAAANNNPKNIIPVTVKNTTYTPGAYGSKDKKKSAESNQDASSDHASSQPQAAQEQSSSQQAQPLQSSQPSTQSQTPVSTSNIVPSSNSSTQQPINYNYSYPNYQSTQYSQSATGDHKPNYNSNYSKPTYYNYNQDSKLNPDDKPGRQT
ncbi:hypothetical protein WICMUC_005871 [Wickerhamomyces mucosus]|uniref:HTH APSES-type domain-containing protein n=1 Tax=Wickerhamomyces mucosus TaxID=1378264 RepID=A0A9P8P2C8_9ASCO|nr:hypothetical protein WICMUC_005871 [Wickerhamomyces mucosus]